MAITEIASLEYDTDVSTWNSVVKIDATHFIVAYAGTDGDGFIKTFSIDGSYGSITELDSLEHDTVSGLYNSLIKIDDTHFMLAYTGSGTDGFIKTFEIDGSYNITQLQSLEHDTSDAYDNSLIKIDATHFALAYSGTSSITGRLKIFTTNGSYTTITQTSTMQFAANPAFQHSLVLVDSAHLLLAYQGAGSDGFIQSFSIDGSYNVTSINTLEHDTTGNFHNSLIQIDSTRYALASRCDNGGTNGKLKVFTLDGSFNITETTSYTFQSGSISYTSLVKSGSIYCLAYADSANDGFLKTFTLDGSFVFTEVDSLEYDTDIALYNSLVSIDDTHLMIGYAGTAGDGFLKTFSLGPTYEILATLGIFALTGPTTSLKVGYKVLSTLGTFTTTGFTTAFFRGYGLLCETGSLLLTGGTTILQRGYKMLLNAGSFAITGFSTISIKLFLLSASAGSFVLTGFSALLKPSNIWSNLTKNLSSWNSGSKNTSTFTNETKNSSDWTNQNKS